MPRNRIQGAIGKVKKLVEGDAGFVEGESKYEVEDRPATKRVISAAKIDARIAKLEAGKARAMAMWDDRIQRMAALKAAMDAA